MIFLFTACADPSPDAASYLAAVRATHDDPERAVALCKDLGGEAGAECGAWAAAAVARNGDADRASDLCLTIASPVWTDECQFLVAEEAERRDGPAAAAARCRSAGRFVDKCLFHVWRSHAQHLRHQAPDDAADDYAGTIAWASGSMNVDLRLEQRFWDTFFDVEFEDELLDPGACSRYPKQDDACRASLATTLARRLNRGDRTGLAPVCPPPEAPDRLAEAVRTSTGIAYVPIAGLDDVARKYYDRRCKSTADPESP